jgi:hypothetical protein
MDRLESKIIELLRRGSPLKAKEIAVILGVERGEVNHYLYSSLKDLVILDKDFRWSLKTNQIENNQSLKSNETRDSYEELFNLLDKSGSSDPYEDIFKMID